MVSCIQTQLGIGGPTRRSRGWPGAPFQNLQKMSFPLTIFVSHSTLTTRLGLEREGNVG